MARKKSDGLTTRQRQSQQIMREKAALKKRKNIMRKLRIALACTAAIAALAGSVWGVKSGIIAQAVAHATGEVYAATGRMGFAVHALYLEGRNRTPMEEIDAALGIKKGDPILSFSLEDARERLEKIPSVRRAAVERALPGELYIRIVEREPVALWQQGGKLSLIDDNGVVMNGIDIGPYQHLPLIVGKDAPQHVGELMQILALEPELTKRFTAAVRVSDRRWNIRLSKHVEVKLPEERPVEAWKKLADLQSEQQLLDRDVSMIDLRLPDRMFIRLAPDLAEKKPSTARET